MRTQYLSIYEFIIASVEDDQSGLNKMNNVIMSLKYIIWHPRKEADDQTVPNKKT